MLSFELAYVSDYAQVRGIYYRDLYIQKTSSKTEFLVSTFAGTGFGNNDGSDIIRRQEFITIGVAPGLRFIDVHRIEVGFQYYNYRYKGRESTSNLSRLKFKFGYRFEDRTLFFKVFFHPSLIEKKLDNPERLYSNDNFIIDFGVGMGIRF